MTVQLELNHNAFAYIKRDELGVPIEIYPLPCVTVEVVEELKVIFFLLFILKMGRE